MSNFSFCSDVNIPYAYRSLKNLMGWSGRTQKIETRNGMALVLDGPLALTVMFPQERVLLDVARDANPYFHLLEALWMLAGHNDVAFPARFNSNIGRYSDDGKTFNGAYGHRWRHYFGYDQLMETTYRLKKNPNDRQVVISMWDPRYDSQIPSKDIPCNVMIMPRIVRGRLNMMTINRSNDLIWGLMGANCVHMTILQEWMAAVIGVPVGIWYHTTNNLHVYEQHWPLLPSNHMDMHDIRAITPPGPYPGFMPLVVNWEVFSEECRDLCGGKDDDFEEPFMNGVVAPMVQSWECRRGGDMEQAIYLARCIEAPDWRRACVEWLNRRVDK